ncbi:hypothetical protein CDEST_04741 [Colletotrichum destructivum]|uniref:Uncharacterized protein n=1 Tax=Colletotrichum destructivum TaxID=34406 RepID=A0AAX4I938_9PEZI|nr:hypothetical protein CDEST_04741 [Colletotrichum destructivum]
MAHIEQQANQHGRSLGQITTSAFVTCDAMATPTNVYTTTTIYCEPCAQKTIPITCPIPTPTANVVINGNGVTDAANPVITGASDGANYQHGGGQTGGGSNPGGNGQSNNPNGAPSGSAGQAPGQPGAAGAGGQPGGQPGQSAVPGAPGAPGTNPAIPLTVVVASAPSFKKSLGLLCAVAMAVGLTSLA